MEQNFSVASNDWNTINPSCKFNFYVCGNQSVDIILTWHTILWYYIISNQCCLAHYPSTWKQSFGNFLQLSRFQTAVFVFLKHSWQYFNFPRSLSSRASVFCQIFSLSFYLFTFSASFFSENWSHLTQFFIHNFILLQPNWLVPTSDCIHYMR